VQSKPSTFGQVTGVPATQPVAELQVSAPLQNTPSSQLLAVPTQTPPAHVSPVVQALPSSQAMPFGVCVHPEPVLQESLVHGLLSSQLVGVPTQTPFEHVSLDVQALPSVHATVLFV
jgi:hypothetical protein